MNTTTPVTVGSPCPAFDNLDESGKRHRLADYQGKNIVLYFYPKDDTPGCTMEACEFRDLTKDFAKKNTVILGVSPDPPALHQKFKRKLDLPFPLLLDEKMVLCHAFGVLVAKTAGERRFWAVNRSTFIIGPNGKIKQVFRAVRPSGHAAAMFKLL